MAKYGLYVSGFFDGIIVVNSLLGLILVIISLLRHILRPLEPAECKVVGNTQKDSFTLPECNPPNFREIIVHAFNAFLTKGYRPEFLLYGYIQQMQGFGAKYMVMAVQTQIQKIDGISISDKIAFIEYFKKCCLLHFLIESTGEAPMAFEEFRNFANLLNFQEEKLYCFVKDYLSMYVSSETQKESFLKEYKKRRYDRLRPRRDVLRVNGPYIQRRYPVGFMKVLLAVNFFKINLNIIKKLAGVDRKTVNDAIFILNCKNLVTEHDNTVARCKNLLITHGMAIIREVP